MAIKFYNTLNKGLTELDKSPGEMVGMYNCGPTVYDYVHIGNLRSYVFADTIKRVLLQNGYGVMQVMNLTDIGHLKSDGDTGEDKMMIALKRENKPVTISAMKEIATFYRDRFVEDLLSLNISYPDKLEFASDHVDDDISLISKLDEKGFTYKTTDGLYFDTSKDPNYGKLGGLNLSKENSESRIGDNSEKRNPSDFALWKFNDKLGYEAPWGKGFPGWHVECSSMSMKFLGETFDIHTGGIDHIPVHHNNEIAQSECATGVPYVKIWMHNAFVTLTDSERMAKSLGNTIRLRDLSDAGVSPHSYRLWLLTAHYRKEVSFTWDAVRAAEVALKRLYAIYDNLPLQSEDRNSYLDSFEEVMRDDLDTPKAISLMWDMLRDENIYVASKKYSLEVMDKYLGLNISNREKIVIPEKVHNLVKDREDAREAQNFALADEIRMQIEKEGFLVKDTKDGPLISKI